MMDPAFAAECRDTVMSTDGLFRYTLWRQFDLANPRYVMFVGLNPSVADHLEDDPTVRRCVDFAKRWGYGALCMANLFAFRATSPAVMKARADPIGPDNDRWLTAMARDAGLIVGAWGKDGSHRGRDQEVLTAIGPMRCLRFNADGSPQHPLYVPAATLPTNLLSAKAVAG